MMIDVGWSLFFGKIFNPKTHEFSQVGIWERSRLIQLNMIGGIGRRYLCKYKTTCRNIRNITTMGVTKTVLKEGNGEMPRVGDKVTVHCTGFGKNRDLAEKFWSTKDAGQQPFTFAVGKGQVIKGWDEGVLGMSLGEVAKLHCSPDYAYGAGGFASWGIMPNSELIFEIEVLSFN